MSLSVKAANDCASNNGRYVYQSVLGTGSFGTVFSAADTTDNNCVVAIKIVKVSQTAMDLVFRRRATRSKLGDAKHEADLLVMLKHPNIVALLEYFKFKDGVLGGIRGLVMVMEICPNGNLQEYLTSKARENCHLEVDQRKKWCKELSVAVQFIHSNGIVHRDLKPPNILLDKDYNLKVADVGLAKTVWDLKSECKEISHNDTFSQYMSSLTGTPCYMAPEVWEEHYNTSSDVFSLGLIFVMMAEVSNPPIPYANWGHGQYCMGKLLSEVPQSRDVPFTDLLHVSLKNTSAQEQEILNGMLRYNYNERLTMEQVVELMNKSVNDRHQNNTRSYWSSCVIS